MPPGAPSLEALAYKVFVGVLSLELGERWHKEITDIERVPIGKKPRWGLLGRKSPVYAPATKYKERYGNTV